jgi:hypothetical protein
MSDFWLQRAVLHLIAPTDLVIEHFGDAKHPPVKATKCLSELILCPSLRLCVADPRVKVAHSLFVFVRHKSLDKESSRVVNWEL